MEKNYNADKSQVRKPLKDPGIQKLRNMIAKNVIIDEIQSVENPSQLLKIMVDNFRGLQFIATGSTALDIQIRSLNL